MNRLFAFLLTLCFFTAYSQEQDPKAKAVLDEVSASAKTHKTIQSDVMFSVTDKDKKQVEKPQTWKVQVKGSRFRLEIPGSTIVSDGKTLWNYNKDAKEVTIKNFDPSNDEMNPAKIFTMYENGYKYKYVKEEKVGTATCHQIDLYPTVKPEKKKFHTVKLYVDKAKKQIVQLRMMMKDGGQQVYEVKGLKANAELSDNLFVFDLKGFKPDQINDERD
jgi:outer membrane lipoprotein carrier protein